MQFALVSIISVVQSKKKKKKKAGLYTILTSGDTLVVPCVDGIGSFVCAPGVLQGSGSRDWFALFILLVCFVRMDFECGWYPLPENDFLRVVFLRFFD